MVCNWYTKLLVGNQAVVNITRQLTNHLYCGLQYTKPTEFQRGRASTMMTMTNGCITTMVFNMIHPRNQPLTWLLVGSQRIDRSWLIPSSKLTWQ